MRPPTHPPTLHSSWPGSNRTGPKYIRGILRNEPINRNSPEKKNKGCYLTGTKDSLHRGCDQISSAWYISKRGFASSPSFTSARIKIDLWLISGGVTVAVVVGLKKGAVAMLKIWIPFAYHISVVDKAPRFDPLPPAVTFCLTEEALTMCQWALRCWGNHVFRAVVLFGFCSLLSLSLINTPPADK